MPLFFRYFHYFIYSDLFNFIPVEFGFFRMEDAMLQSLSQEQSALVKDLDEELAQEDLISHGITKDILRDILHTAKKLRSFVGAK